MWCCQLPVDQVSLPVFPVNGEAELLDFLDSSLAEEEEEEDSFRSLGAPYLAGVRSGLFFGLELFSVFGFYFFIYFFTIQVVVIKTVKSIDFQDQTTSFPAPQSQNATELRLADGPSFKFCLDDKHSDHCVLVAEHDVSHPLLVFRPDLQAKSPSSPSSPTLEGRRRPETLLIWQERERLQQQRDKAT